MYYIALFLSLFIASAGFSEKKVEPLQYVNVSGSCEWESIGNPGFLRIHGKGGKITGHIYQKDAATGGMFRVSLDDFTTGIALRDTHMKEKYLETAKHKEAVLYLDSAFIPLDKEFEWSGKLSLKGVEKPVKGRGKLHFKDGKKHVNASFSITVSDFGIEIPSYLGVTMAKDVDISVTAVTE